MFRISGGQALQPGKVQHCVRQVAVYLTPQLLIVSAQPGKDGAAAATVSGDLDAQFAAAAAYKPKLSLKPPIRYRLAVRAPDPCAPAKCRGVTRQ